MKEMKQDSSTIAWNKMGDEWVELAQTGESRNCFIMPNMLKFMGDVAGKRILDLGCGEGGYSRELAKKRRAACFGRLLKKGDRNCLLTGRKRESENSAFCKKQQ